MNVLVVDDDPSLLRAMQDLLVLVGYEVRIAPGGEAALRLLDEQAPDLIVADVLMGRMSGIALAEKVRANPAWQHIPILFISASSTPAEEHAIDAFTHATFLRKPFGAQELQDAVEAALAVG